MGKDNTIVQFESQKNHFSVPIRKFHAVTP